MTAEERGIGLKADCSDQITEGKWIQCSTLEQRSNEKSLELVSMSIFSLLSFTVSGASELFHTVISIRN